MESEFRFAPSKGVPTSMIQALELKYVQLKSQLEDALEKGPEKLQLLTKTANNELSILDEELVQRELKLRQAELDVSVKIPLNVP